MVSSEEQPLKTKVDPTAGDLKKRNWREKLAYIKENITIEPVLACYVVPGSLSKLATQDLNLDKACRVNKNFGEAVCNALIAREGNNYLKEELAVQQLVAAMESWKSIVLTAFPSILILFLGAWSDKTRRRKICIILPLVGHLLMCLSNMLNVYFFYESTVQVTMFFEAFFLAISGGWITMYMGAFSYISDVSSEQSRTLRIGIANLCLTAGTPIGTVLSGVLLKHIGYYGVFLLCSLMYAFSLFYACYCIEDPTPPETCEKEASGVLGFLKSFFDGKNAKNTLKVAFKKGPNHRRTKYILILATIAFTYGPEYGENTIRYLFTRYRFNWDALKYSFYGTFQIATHCIGAVISISLFSHRFQWDDSVLGIISLGSKIVGSLTTAFARNTKEMYIAVALETFNATTFTALRSISSKLCTSDDLGKVISVFNLMEVLTSMVFGPTYSWIYMLTMKINPSITYFVTTSLAILAFLIFGWFYIEHRKISKSEHTKKEIRVEDEKLESQTNEHIDKLLSSIEAEGQKEENSLN